MENDAEFDFDFDHDQKRDIDNFFNEEWIVDRKEFLVSRILGLLGQSKIWGISGLGGILGVSGNVCTS